MSWSAFAQGFAQGFVPTYNQARRDRVAQEDELFRIRLEQRNALQESQNAQDRNWQRAGDILASLPGEQPAELQARIFADLQNGSNFDDARDHWFELADQGLIQRVTGQEEPEQSLDSMPEVMGEDNAPVDPLNTPSQEQRLGFDSAPQPGAEASVAPLVEPSTGTSEEDQEEPGFAQRIEDTFRSVGEGIDRRRQETINRNVERRLAQYDEMMGRDRETGGDPLATARRERSRNVPAGEANQIAILSSRDVVNIQDISSVNDAYVARSILERRNDEQAQQQLAQVNGIIASMTELPSVFNQSDVPAIDAMIREAQTGQGAFGNAEPAAVETWVSNATAYRDAVATQDLPSIQSLSEPEDALGVLADYRSGVRYQNAPPDYLDEVEARASALEAVAAAEEGGNSSTPELIDHWTTYYLAEGRGDTAAMQEAQTNINAINAANETVTEQYGELSPADVFRIVGTNSEGQPIVERAAGMMVDESGRVRYADGRRASVDEFQVADGLPADILSQTNTHRADVQKINTDLQGVVGATRLAGEVLDIVSEYPDAITWGGALASTAAGAARNISSLETVLGTISGDFEAAMEDGQITGAEFDSAMRSSGALRPGESMATIDSDTLAARLSENLESSETAALGRATNLVRAKTLLMAFRLGGLEGQSGQALSNRDFERILDIVRPRGGDAAQMATGLRDYISGRYDAVRTAAETLETANTTEALRVAHGVEVRFEIAPDIDEYFNNRIGQDPQFAGWANFLLGDTIRPVQGSTPQSAPEPQQQEEAPSSPSGPPVGFEADGYRFKGGDPNDPDNWEPIQ